MPVVLFTALNEHNSTRKMIHDLLIKIWRPPFRGEIIFASRKYEPKPLALSECFRDLVGTVSFLVREVNIAPKFRHWNGDAKSTLEKLTIPVNKMIRPLVACANEGIVHPNKGDIRPDLSSWSHVRIVRPQIRG